MATPPEQPWSNHEKNYLLAEIIKAANPPANVLFSVIQNVQLQPRWDETPLPPGRSLNSCRNAFEEMRRTLPVSVGTPMGAMAPSPLSGPIPTLKRAYPYEASFTGGSSGREIRPKLPMSAAVHAQPSPTEPPAKKKRGRPTKAEALAKAEAAAASAVSYGEPGPVSLSRPVSHNTPQAQTQQAQPPPPPAAVEEEPTRESRPSLPPVTRMPIASMLTPARELETGGQSQPGSSSGRRRRARSTKSEPNDSPIRRPPETSTEYESPYGRSNAPDTPARAAISRHRDETTSAARDIPSIRPPDDLVDRPRSHESERS
ncbi:hypothetical protein CKM354_000045600 [Cercospora kikuchii]|uniref:Myb-like domain-containing protein n=1 Tax=Cercospora kikuchii TaxID=84275 RepID=A0A9P3FB06_9PEZI|nr:uncharacterized protein CKM354_000045600 [Cercospora kikuchii]GIZ36992.1 hypothetical protein CKM354_000045600 [Cercospora kikuchii]